MALKELLQLLRKIKQAHPEAADADVWAVSNYHNEQFMVSYVGYDKRHKPNRIKLEQA